MMGQSATGKYLMIMTSNADISVICGDDCIAIKEFMRDGSIEIVSTSGDTLRNVMSYLDDTSKECAVLCDAKYPLFEHVKDRHLRAVMALFLGCDVYVKGMSNIGPKLLNGIIIRSTQPTLRDDQMHLYSNTSRSICSRRHRDSIMMLCTPTSGCCSMNQQI